MVAPRTLGATLLFLRIKRVVVQVMKNAEKGENAL